MRRAIGQLEATQATAREKTIVAEETSQKFEVALQRAELANHTKSEFLSKRPSYSRTPLNAIIGFSEVMMGKYLVRSANSIMLDKH